MSVSWLKQGEESAKMHEQEKINQEAKKAEQGKSFRFFIKKGQEASIIFVDGVLGPKGYLTPPRFYEHFTIMPGGKWGNVVCPQQTLPQSGEKCPLCETKDKASLVSLFTVVDLTPYTTKNGIVIPFTRKLFVAKPTTFELINKLAIKRGGLAGIKFDVSRTGDKSPSVGDVFDFQEKYTDLAALKAQFTRTFKTKEGTEKTVCEFEAIDYDKEIPFRSGDELRAMGFGNPVGTMNMGGTSEGNVGSGEDYKDML